MGIPLLRGGGRELLLPPASTGGRNLSLPLQVRDREGVIYSYPCKFIKVTVPKLRVQIEHKGH